MRNRFSFFRLGCLALMCASSPILLSKDDLNRRAALQGANKSSEEYRKLFSTLLNPNGVDFEEFGSDSKAISVIGMFSDEKLSGAELKVMHWIDFKSPEGLNCIHPAEVDAFNHRAKVKRQTLEETVDEERINAENRISSQRSRLDKKLRSEAEAELQELKEKSIKMAEEKLLREQKDDLQRMLDLEKKMQRQEDESRAISELESKLQKQEIERRKYDLFEKSTENKINELNEITLNKKKKISDNSYLDMIAEELKAEDQASTSSREPLFQGSLWRISPTGSIKSEQQNKAKYSELNDQVEMKNVSSDTFSTQDKSVVLDSLDRLEKARSFNREPQLNQSINSPSTDVYPNWASGSKLLEKALDKCRLSDEYLVLSFNSRGVSVPKDLIIKDLQKYGISPGKTKQAITFIECDANPKTLDRKVEDLLIMSGIWDGPGYVVIELPGNTSTSTAKIVRACPLSYSRNFQSNAFSFKGNNNR